MPAHYDRLDLDDDDETVTLAESTRSTSNLKPTVYYDDGPFDAPSSDEEEAFLSKDPVGPLTPGAVENGFAPGHQKRPSSLRFLVYTLCALISLSALIGIIAAQSYVGTVYRLPGYKKMTMDHLFNGTFFTEHKSLAWVPEAGDGVFSIVDGNDIKLVDLKTNTTSTLVSLNDIKDESGSPLAFSNWQLSPDMEYLLLKATTRNNGDEDASINSATNPPSTAFAVWSPTGQSIAYVTNNDLYILPSPSPSATPVRITDSGSSTLFHGVPDWVYEEEIFSADSALWWSPDSSKLAFLSFDETLVDVFSFPIYNPTDDSTTVVPYPSELKMRYPKPGYNNPLVTVHVYDISSKKSVELEWADHHPKENSVIMEVTWVADQQLMLKELNRNADDGHVVLFDLTTGKKEGVTVRKLGKDGEEADEGWVEPTQSIYPLPKEWAISGGTAYLDIVPTKEGYNHIALFSPANSSEPLFLTHGSWEVSGVKAVDVKNGLVYFQAAAPTSVERNLYSVALPSSADALSDIVSLSYTPEPSYFSTDFSPEGGFYLLSYHGPDIPWQRVVQAGNNSFDYLLTDNARLSNITAEYEAPTIIHSTIENDGYELNVKEIRPPRMDDSGRTKYAVLFKVYGGPNSQTVTTRWTREWEDFVACSLQHIVVIVDGRGTGAKGRALRSAVKGNLGFYETRDQIYAARLWAGKDYVDPKRIGIWGWSYGGFMSAKVAEADAGIHSLAMSVAPVTSWRLYDSIYTERYMNLPDLNPGGYINASISNVTAFHKVDYLLAHGSGDDNVHFANSAHLLDMLTAERVRKFRFRMFTDSDHGISRRGAKQEIYEFLTSFLIEKWGKGGRRRGW
ncbi:dipeptidyl aminopeptidase [Hymenopellis radicata]|nr:dipeptidyl aminopeptidase [Hymenopellis radicata]